MNNRPTWVAGRGNVLSRCSCTGQIWSILGSVISARHMFIELKCRTWQQWNPRQRSGWRILCELTPTSDSGAPDISHHHGARMMVFSHAAWPARDDAIFTTITVARGRRTTRWNLSASAKATDTWLFYMHAEWISARNDIYTSGGDRRRHDTLRCRETAKPEGNGRNCVSSYG